jgi:hypothetical protein
MSARWQACGPIRIDAGVLSFAPGMLAGLVACLIPSSADRTVLAPFAVAGALLPFFNFLVPILGFMKIKGSPFPALAKRFSKPLFWAAVFYVYCIASFLYWLAAPIIASIRGRITWWAALLGVPLVIVYVVALKFGTDKLNEGVGKPKEKLVAHHEDPPPAAEGEAAS